MTNPLHMGMDLVIPWIYPRPNSRADSTSYMGIDTIWWWDLAIITFEYFHYRHMYPFMGACLVKMKNRTSVCQLFEIIHFLGIQRLIWSPIFEYHPHNYHFLPRSMWMSRSLSTQIWMKTRYIRMEFVAQFSMITIPNHNFIDICSIY